MNQLLTGRTAIRPSTFIRLSIFIFLLAAPIVALAISPAGKYLVKVKTGRKTYSGIFKYADSSGIELKANRKFGQFIRGKPAVDIHIKRGEIKTIIFRKKDKFQDYLGASEGIGLLSSLIAFALVWIVPIMSLILISAALILTPIMMVIGWSADEKISIDYSEEKYYQNMSKMNHFKF